MLEIFTILHLVFAIALIVLVLIQQGKGAAMGASFGSGASQTVFGSQGAGSFMLKITAFFALLFFATSLMLGHLNMQAPSSSQGNLLDSVEKLSQAQSMQKSEAQQAMSQLNQPAPAASPNKYNINFDKK